METYDNDEVRRGAYRSAVEYLVLKALAGKRSIVEVAYRYLVLGERRSDIEKELGISDGVLRDAVWMNLLLVPGKHRAAEALVRVVVPVILEKVEPVIRGNVCVLCGEAVSLSSAEKHIRTWHPDVVVRVVSAVTSEAIARLHSSGSRDTNASTSPPDGLEEDRSPSDTGCH